MNYSVLPPTPPLPPAGVATALANYYTTAEHSLELLSKAEAPDIHKASAHSKQTQPPTAAASARGRRRSPSTASEATHMAWSCTVVFFSDDLTTAAIAAISVASCGASPVILSPTDVAT